MRFMGPPSAAGNLPTSAVLPGIPLSPCSIAYIAAPARLDLPIRR